MSLRKTIVCCTVPTRVCSAIQIAIASGVMGSSDVMSVSVALYRTLHPIPDATPLRMSGEGTPSNHGVHRRRWLTARLLTAGREFI